MELPDNLRRPLVRTVPMEERLMIESAMTAMQERTPRDKAAYITHEAERMARELDKAGAIGPYVYSCSYDGGVYFMRAEEQ